MSPDSTLATSMQPNTSLHNGSSVALTRVLRGRVTEVTDACAIVAWGHCWAIVAHVGYVVGAVRKLYPSRMPAAETFHESRRSARVPMKVVITVEGGPERRTCDGETVNVNIHGALITTVMGLSVGMRVSIHAYLTNKRAAAHVVYIDPKNPLRCGVELDEPRNIWGVTMPPDNWDETSV